MNAIETLRENVGKLSEHDRDFAQSLLEQAAGRGLSAKQFAWVDRLAARATTPPASIGDITGIVSLMTDAMGRGAKRPRIRLRTPGGLDLVLAIAGPTSREPGTVWVMSAGSFGDRAFYGRIAKDGTFSPRGDATAENTPEIVAMLRAMAMDPAGTAAAYGRTTGACCFCSADLSDPISVEVGYGRICAKKYGLPWGARS